MGSKICNPDLANLLDKIAESGKAAFYKGDIADRIIRQVQKAGGVMTHSDLEQFNVRLPSSGTYYLSGLRDYFLAAALFRWCTYRSDPPPPTSPLRITRAIAQLEKIGHPTQRYDDWHRVIGSVNSCIILEVGTLAGAADPRRDGLALGL